jgi:hypothetical protein
VQTQELQEVPSKELFILDGIFDQIQILQKISPNKNLLTPKDKERSKTKKEAKGP